MESNNRGLCRVVQSGKFVRNLTLDPKKVESGLHLPVAFSHIPSYIQLHEMPVSRQKNCVVKMMYNMDPHVIDITSMN
jgi:hypothetical protein